ncbi:transcriptional regulator, TetR family [Thermoactinomyces sp. DSM 45891]|uniref:TetR/AcrR family transcriptional regulator n=1 Tax=Thermoactinomyces sp. DSM 45891 TaxID=1761907 RepID=UPI0009185AF0|nr:TetR/AcrR family transcriptional regulator [Thermoactinomyces sp. DSM 45891]SFX31716.1 transcriptional regulator, TetR family [Thermoactinomyces sp. DSM 45891]
MRHQKVDVILQAAVEVFSDQGFDQAKMDDIAQAAGVAKGTIYYHFKSKEDLFTGLMDEGMEKLIDCVKRHIDSEDSPVDQMHGLIRAHSQFFMENGKLAKLLLNEAFGTKERQQKFRASIREYIQLIESLIERGISTGDFQFDYPSEMAISIFGAGSVLVLHKLYTLEDRAWTSEESEELTQMIIQSLSQLVFRSLLIK